MACKIRVNEAVLKCIITSQEFFFPEFKKLNAYVSGKKTYVQR